ncbi:MAG: helix-turn-helix transcriptional regulator [Atopobiaceae bacterium]|nr:helix-turn-helix transcriptional regulator [Atopobiaceae bacterium]
MASNADVSTGRRSKGNDGLVRLRKSAGFQSARKFAEAVGLSPTTYCRYERTPAGKGCGIPVRSAWEIADRLGTTIDAVVGRAEAPADDDRRDLNAFYRSLSDSGKASLDEYVRYLDFRERVLESEGR